MDWISLSSTDLYTETLLSEGWFLKMEGFGGWLVMRVELSGWD